MKIIEFVGILGGGALRSTRGLMKMANLVITLLTPSTLNSNSSPNVITI